MRFHVAQFVRTSTDAIARSLALLGLIDRGVYKSSHDAPHKSCEISHDFFWSPVRANKSSHDLCEAHTASCEAHTIVLSRSFAAVRIDPSTMDPMDEIATMMETVGAPLYTVLKKTRRMHDDHERG